MPIFFDFIKINFDNFIFNFVPLIISLLLMILGTIIDIKENEKNSVIIISLSFIVPALFSLNGFIISGFSPFKFILLSVILWAVFVPFHSIYPSQAIKNIKFLPLLISNGFLIYAFFIMKNPDFTIILMGIILSLIPLLFYIKALLKNKRHILQTLLIMFGGGFSLAFALNLPASSLGSFMFPFGAFMNYVGSIIYIKYYFGSIKSSVDENQFNLFTVICFFFLISSNLISLGVNL